MLTNWLITWTKAIFFRLRPIKSCFCELTKVDNFQLNWAHTRSTFPNFGDSWKAKFSKKSRDKICSDQLDNFCNAFKLEYNWVLPQLIFKDKSFSFEGRDKLTHVLEFEKDYASEYEKMIKIKDDLISYKMSCIMTMKITINLFIFKNVIIQYHKVW